MIDIQTAIRSSAVLYSDEIGSVKTTTIKRKYIESIFMMNGNKLLTIEELLQEIEKRFLLHFETEEIKKIVNQSDDFFEYNEITTHLNLTQKRMNSLQNKETSKIDDVISRFIKEHSEFSDLDVLSIIHRFLYELLNSNIATYSYIVSPKKQTEKPRLINPSLFPEKAGEMINSFIAWKDEIKDREIYKLVSFSIEYALVTNNSDGQVYTEALKTKKFYLDSNIIYRAIGTDGDYRKQRVLYFLDKCKANGQSFYISRYTKEEFNESIDRHIKELSRISFGSINPELFKIANCDSDFYTFYHTWRQGKQTKSLSLFKAFILSEYDKLIKKYDIVEDYSLPFDENNQKIKKQILNYYNEINSIKKDSGFNSTIDAKNVLIIEKRRNVNNIGLQDTKYYLLSSDQKLREWDNKHSMNQPLLMIPSQWMGLLLKYVSRTSDDFASFLSFLRFPKQESVLSPEELEDVVAGISEMTENFQTQATIMNHLVSDKFSKILSGDKCELRENAIQFTRNFLEEMYIGELNEKDKTNEELTRNLKLKYEKQIIENKKQSIETKKDNLSKILKLLLGNKTKADKKIEKSRKIRLGAFITFSFIFYLTQFILFLKLGWEKIEPITYFLGIPYPFISYVVLAFSGKDFNPFKVFQRDFIKNQIYKKESIDIAEIEDIENELENLTIQEKEIE